MDRLDDWDLERIGHNRKYGPETLAKFIDRYLLGHKSAHVEQLERRLSQVRK